MGALSNEPLHRRFWFRVLVTETCWLWTGPLNPKSGYGMQIQHRGRKYQAHRLAYESIVGPIPDGLQLDHLCRVRHCVNPAHLEAVTARVNTLRGNSTSALNHRKTHCPQGHEYSPENTYQGKKARHCRACARNYQARRREQRRAA